MAKLSDAGDRSRQKLPSAADRVCARRCTGVEFDCLIESGFSGWARIGDHDAFRTHNTDVVGRIAVAVVNGQTEFEIGIAQIQRFG